MVQLQYSPFKNLLSKLPAKFSPLITCSKCSNVLVRSSEGQQTMFLNHFLNISLINIRGLLIVDVTDTVIQVGQYLPITY